MEQTATILIIAILLILALVVGLLTLIIFKMSKQNNSSANSVAQQPAGEVSHPDVSRSNFHPAIVDRLKEIQGVKPKKRADIFCQNHSEEPGETVCAICDKLFCKACIKPFKTMHFCKEHLPLIMRHDWEEVVTIKTSTHDPEQGVRLYDVKKEIFEKDDLPTYIETHYKINVDQDYIETYLVMFGIKEDLDKTKAIIAKSTL